MVFLFSTRYSGWPAPGPWVACVENPEVEWVEPYVEELIADVTSPGDCDASDASDEIRRRCHVASGDTPKEALERLMSNERAACAISELNPEYGAERC